MKVSILSVFPDLFSSFLQTSLIKRAQDSGKVDILTQSYFAYVEPKERIDAPTFGHGAGMLIRPDVVQSALEDIQSKRGNGLRIFFSPAGRVLDQSYLQELAQKVQASSHLILVSARYEGMDARVEQEYADEIVSIGDYVLMGGDLPAMVLLEGLLRHVPGIVGKTESVEHDSFTGPYVDHPEYTAPVVWKEKEVPEVLRSGNHALIDEFRRSQAVKRTVLNHFDWLRTWSLPAPEKQAVLEMIPHHYVALCHSEVLIGPEKQPGTTSVTSIDIHDIARSCKTYGIQHYSIVTPLEDQKAIVSTLLDFWQKGSGPEYNPSRHNALKTVSLADSVDQVMAEIEKKEGKKPLLVATSARAIEGVEKISFFDQKKVWSLERPVLLVFGTGKGFTQEFLKKCDFLLLPVSGYTDFNHLSVRSAVAIILDRWLGINMKIRK